ncbi:hypothetical protein N0V94_009606 [Neodidymelliopsis sp. IMI 364377]|nr:hypothetical protein N0V94_009606 [Neodidymelliopsis sp. IMI 364377]
MQTALLTSPGSRETAWDNTPQLTARVGPIYLTPSSPHCSVSPPPRPATAPSPQVPIPFSVFPSAYRNAGNQETTSTKVEGAVQLPEQPPHGREGHEETHESFTATVHQQQQQQQQQQPPRDTHIKEEVRIYEEERRRPQQQSQQQPQQREEIHIHEETRYRQPERAQFDRQSQFESHQFDARQQSRQEGRQQTNDR